MNKIDWQMWKRHPLIRLLLSALVAGVMIGGLFVSGLLDPKLWADTHANPLQSEGVIHNIRSTSYAGQGLFDLVNPANTETFEVNSYIASTALKDGLKARVSFSPNLKHVYNIQILTNDGNTYDQDYYEPNALFQRFQTLPVFTLLFMILLLISSIIYGSLNLLDWFIKPVSKYTTLISRLEQADYNAGFGIVVRPLGTNNKSYRFHLTKTDFLITDGAEILEITYTPFLHYVKRLKVVSEKDLPERLRHSDIVQPESRQALLHYLNSWQFSFFLYRDLVAALILLAISIVVAISMLPLLFEPLNTRYHLYEPVLLMSMAALSLTIGIFFIRNFYLKWYDIKRPKKLTEGPVLSKWRVNGTSNENRRQIVVADGGLDAGSDAIHKFDVSTQIYDELKVGDTVKIEHTPRMHLILRLEITGHQELVKLN